MAAKRVRVSIDDGTTYLTLPGNTGDLKNDGATIDDTIFGQDFMSNQTGLINWTLSANALYKGFAGYVATIKKSGTPTTFTTEAFSLVTGKTYKITDASKNVWDRTTVLHFFDNAAAVDVANILYIDYLFGQVTFVGGYTPTGPITATGKYMPTAAIGCTNTFTLTQKANSNDTTCMTDAQANGGNREFDYGLKTVTLELKGIYKAADAFIALLQARAECIIEINPDGNMKSVCRGFYKPSTTDFSGKVGDLEASTIDFSLSVPDVSTLPYPFAWMHTTDTTLNQAVINCLDSWENNDHISVAYLPDGTNGFSGDSIVTDISLAGGLEVMNEFTANFQGSGAISAYP